ncbi:MAG: hypothetical protein IPJ34_11880 [Myxococcales bacterium]|nr:hypothetical protein [Myxococcales bacterium]
MSAKRKPIPAPLACPVSARPQRPLTASLVRGGLPTVAALLAACTALACSEAREVPGAHADPEESHVGLATKAKKPPPSPSDPLPGFGGLETDPPVVEPAKHPPTVKGEPAAVKPVPPVPSTISPAVPGGLKATLPPPAPVHPKPIAPPKKSPKLAGDVAAVDPSI